MKFKFRNVMKKTTLLLSIFTMTVSPMAAYAGEFEYINKFGTQDKIALGNTYVTVPKTIESKDEEFRGVWISSVFNLDFPSKKGLSQEEFKREYLKVLSDLEALNINSVIFQVRPKLDTFYKSKINPWSEFLTGIENKDPGWDPLTWMINETHKKNMEFHAWFNPYRVTNSKDNRSKQEQLNSLSSKNWARNNPDEVYSYDGKLYLNPSSDKSISHIVDSIMEVVENYNIDGVHLDDYFYPYRSIHEKDSYYFPEEKIDFEKNKDKFKDVGQYRRSNTDKLVFTISNNIKNYNKANKKDVVFGISPFGIWGHEEVHPIGCPEGVGSKTPKSSQASYDNIFADTRKWVKNNWVDYMAPQLYWTFDEKAAPYGELVAWWSDVVKGTDVDLYIGHANYKKAEVNGKNNSWKNPREISNQLKFNSNFEEVKGSIFFRYKSLLKSNNTVNNQFIDILKNEHYSKKANPKVKTSVGSMGKASDEILDKYVLEHEEGNIISWKDLSKNNSKYYLIYREEKGIYDLGINRELISKIENTKNEKYFSYLDKDLKPNKKYIYSIIPQNN